MSEGEVFAPPEWDQSEKLAAWRLLWSVSQDLEIPISPTLVSTMDICFRYFQAQSRPPLPLFIVVTAALFIAGKVERDETVLNSLCRSVTKAIRGNLSNLSKTLGVTDKWFADLDSSAGIKEFEVIVAKSEVMVLTCMGWEFPRHNPFDFLSKWIAQLSSALEEAGKPAYKVDSLDHLALELVCCHFLSSEYLSLSPSQMAASALEVAWQKLNFHTDPSLKHWTEIVQFEEPVDDSLVRYVQAMMDARESLVGT